MNGNTKLGIFLSFLILIQNTQAKENFNSEVDKASPSNRTEANAKLFPFLFALIKFSNEKCFSTDGIDGACHSPLDCARMGGIGKGKCAEGFGTCCIFNAQCSNSTRSITIKRNVTHLISPDNNKRYPCKFIIPKQSGICQIRLDFKEFSLQQPKEGDCFEEFFTINGADNVDKFTLCGIVKPMSHLYLHFGESDTITLNLNTAMPTSKYNIQATMIRCDDMQKAPDGCTQFYTEEMSQVQSFNYPMEQLNKQRYMVCIKSFPGSSEITWSPCKIPTGGAMSSFFISGSLPNAGTDPTHPKKDGECMGDFISFVDQGRYCGSSFSDVTSKAKPYMMWVNFNEQETQFPSGPVNPDTGCPFGWTCGSGLVCPEIDSCDAPLYITELDDDGNTGFCLEYSVK